MQTSYSKLKIDQIQFRLHVPFRTPPRKLVGFRGAASQQYEGRETDEVVREKVRSVYPSDLGSGLPFTSWV